MLLKNISPAELNEKLQAKQDFRLIDVREPEEFVVAELDGAEQLPLSQFEQWIGRLRPSEEIVVVCHHGVRSAAVCRYLATNGFEKIFNLSGGIDAWSTEVDRRVPRY